MCLIYNSEPRLHRPSACQRHMRVYVRAAVLRYEYFCIVYPPSNKQKNGIVVACTIEYCEIIVDFNVPSGGAFNVPGGGALNVPSGSALTLNP